MPFSADKLQKLRAARGLTQQQLADKSDISRGYLARLLAGQQSPSVNVAEQLARALKCKLKDLV